MRPASHHGSHRRSRRVPPAVQRSLQQTGTRSGHWCRRWRNQLGGVAAHLPPAATRISFSNANHLPWRYSPLRAAWYESQGEAQRVLVVGTMEDPVPGPGEVRIAIQRSGINPGDVKKRSDAFGVGMPYPRVIPHSDGSGYVDLEGEGVSSGLLGERVWCFGAQSYRPFGTAAEFAVVPLSHVTRLPSTASWDQGACLGIPGITAHRAVHVGGDVKGRVVLVQGGGGAVGLAAVAIATHAGARVIATVRTETDATIARGAGADEVLRTDGLSSEEIVERVLSVAPDGVDHVVEVAFHANVAVDDRVLKLGGSIASYATNRPNPAIPFWSLAFKNARLYFLGSDDFPPEAKRRAATDLSTDARGRLAGLSDRACAVLGRDRDRSRADRTRRHRRSCASRRDGWGPLAGRMEQDPADPLSARCARPSVANAAMPHQHRGHSRSRGELVGQGGLGHHRAGRRGRLFGNERGVSPVVPIRSAGASGGQTPRTYSRSQGFDRRDRGGVVLLRGATPALRTPYIPAVRPGVRLQT